jgi:hypothetical protein
MGGGEGVEQQHHVTGPLRVPAVDERLAGRAVARQLICQTRSPGTNGPISANSIPAPGMRAT